MQVGTTIVVNAWGRFPAKTRKCVGIKEDQKYGKRYVFDDGVEWTESNLKSNFALWKSRNGY